MKIVKAKKWGNSLAVRIPKEVVENFKLADGTNIVLHMDPTKGLIALIPSEKNVPTLEELLAGITKDNIHPETDWGKPMGSEFW